MSKLNVSIIQANLSWENKEANLSMFESRIRGAAGRKEVVILPEMFSTGFSMNPAKLAETMDGPTLQWMRNISAEQKIILTGSLIIEENGAYYNRLIWMLPNGQFGYYDKRHLFAYAGEDKHYHGGNKRLIASVKGWKINLQICYDLRFPVWARQSDSSLDQVNISPGERTNRNVEYDMLVYVANWPERRNHAWKTLLQARAIENQCYVIAVNRVGNDGNDIYHSGDSMIVDPLGEVLYTKAHEEDLFTIQLDKNHLDELRNRLPFLNDADDFLIQT
ncbi:MAG: nitrilase family protein [Chitinophagaceae bacterium]|nr:MAG: nitrilase family protein [Chitinophagaceae bacterium]